MQLDGTQLGNFSNLTDVTAKAPISGGGSSQNFAVSTPQKRSHSAVFAQTRKI